jgi:hypothetical protein
MLLGVPTGWFTPIHPNPRTASRSSSPSTAAATPLTITARTGSGIAPTDAERGDEIQTGVMRLLVEGAPVDVSISTRVRTHDRLMP